MPFDTAGVGIAIQQIDDETGSWDNGTSLVANVAKRMSNVHENFSVQGEFSYSLAGPSVSQSISGQSYTIDATIITLAGYGVYFHPLNDQLSVSGRVGLLYESVDIETSGGFSNSDTDTGLSYGLGMAYQLKDNMSVAANYTIVEADVSHIGVGVSMAY